MESHQIPKNVKDFEFHLIGDMTIKQFAYLASGLGLAYLVFVLLAGSLPYIAYPIIVLLGGAGIALAFLPIMERPLDHWLAAYFGAIFSPTERKFESADLALDNPKFSNRLELYLDAFYAPATYQEPATIPSTPQPKPIITAGVPSVPMSKPNAPVKTVPSSITQATAQSAPVQQTPAPQPIPASTSQQASQPVSPSSLPDPADLHKSVELAQQAQIIKAKILETEKRLNDIKAQAAVPGTDTAQFTDRFQQTLNELQELNKRAVEISRDLALLSQTPVNPAIKKIVIAPTSARAADSKLILTTVPNMINGIVTDTQGNYLEGVIVVTHDKQGLPVRALKSNKLGQFLAATPLGNGVYTLTFEKDGFIFDTLQIGLDGAVMPPIKVLAKEGIIHG